MLNHDGMWTAQYLTLAEVDLGPRPSGVFGPRRTSISNLLDR